MKKRNCFVEILVLLIIAALLPLQSFARVGGVRVCHLGVAPLLGNCPTIEKLVFLANNSKALIRLAVSGAGNHEMTEEVVTALCLGQVQEVLLDGNQQLETMAWYGTSSAGITGLHTLWNPKLAFNQPVPAWQLSVTVRSKTVVWVLPKKCGNLSRLRVVTEQEVVIRTPPPPPTAPPPQRIGFADAAPRSTIEKGGEFNAGSTQSSASFAVIPKSPDINVTQNGGGANVKNSASSASSSSSSSSASNQNNINNTNLNQNNNNAIAQSQNVVPVNVVVNTGPGNANGTATGSGNQNAGATQGNNP